MRMKRGEMAGWRAGAEFAYLRVRKVRREQAGNESFLPMKETNYSRDL
jgi:hypothetical protein